MTRHFFASCLMVAAGAVLTAGQQQPQFHANTDLVSVYATVLDAEGHLVTGLTADQFEILDNGRSQPIALFASDSQPITIVVMLDRSGSVTENFDLVRRATEQLVANLLPGDRARIGSFSREVLINPVTFTSDQNELIRILRYDLQAGGPTPLWEATTAAMDALRDEPGRRVVLLFSDGKNSPTFTQADIEFDDVRERARREDVMVYAIGLSSDCGAAPTPSSLGELLFQRRGPRVRGGRIGGGGRGGPGLPGLPIGPGGLRLPPGTPLPPPRGGSFDRGAPCRPTAPDPDLHTLAWDGGGGYFVLDRAGDLGTTFSRVADELHQQYLLAFQTPARDGQVHRLRVRARTAGVTVRARTSYVAPAR